MKVRITLTGTAEFPDERAIAWIAELNRNDERAFFAVQDILGGETDTVVTAVEEEN